MVNNNSQVKTYKKHKYSLSYIISHFYIYLILLVMYAPILLLIFYSFTDSNMIGQLGGFSFNNYAMLFSSTNSISNKIWDAVKNTVVVALVSSVIATLLGSLGAIGIFYSKKKVKTTLNAVTQIPVINAEIVMALSLTILFVFCQIKFSFVTLIIGHVVLAIPFVVLSVQPKLTQMDPNLYEAALDLGATQTQALIKIILPEIFPGVLSGFLLSVTLSLDDYIITAFTKPRISFDTLSTYVEAVTKRSGLPPQLWSLTTLIFAIVLIGMMTYCFKMKNKAKKERKL